MPPPPRIAYVIDPRFSGGTSAAVAAELKVARSFGQVEVHAIESRMFHGRRLAPALDKVLDDLGLTPIWDEGTVAADIVVLHNPSFLKFQERMDRCILCRELVVVTHENFVRPGGAEGFDVASCLRQIDAATLALRKVIAPISPANRATVAAWQEGARLPGGWAVLDDDWFNICDFPLAPPTRSPADRRGRHSRPGFEKFPPLDILDACFPAQAAANVILGADSLMEAAGSHPHWKLLPFGGLDLPRYFEMVDFMVYFTSPAWRESFGRVLAEALAAGKVVISDPDTAATFGGGVIAAHPADVDAIVARHVAEPALYRAQVAAGQTALARYSAERFAGMFAARLDAARGWAAA